MQLLLFHESEYAGKALCVPRTAERKSLPYLALCSRKHSVMAVVREERVLR